MPRDGRPQEPTPTAAPGGATQARGSERQHESLLAALQAREEELRRLTESPGWKVALVTNRVLRALLPPGTRRRRLAKAAWLRSGALVRHRRAVAGAARGQAPGSGPEARGGAEAPGPSPVRGITARKFRVAYLVGTLEFESRRYRVSNLEEALRRAGVEANHFTETDLPDRLPEILRYDVLVLFRTAWTPAVARLLEGAAAQGLPAVYDVDDYVFDPGVIPHVRAIRNWPASAVEEYADGVRRYRRVLEACAYFTGPTSFLVERARQLGKRGYLIPNSLNQVQLDLALELLFDRATDGDVVIGYFSGTPTHQADFAVACPALVRLMQALPQVRLLVVGHLDLDDFPELGRLGERVATRPVVDWRELPRHIASADVNLVPLELDNPFCEAKSELKYFEAAILGIPTVASPTRTYREVVAHGETGLLARTEEEWYACLHRLVVDAGFRERLGRQARAHASERYTPGRVADDALTAYRDIILDARQRRGVPPDALAVSFVLTPPTPGSGGHKTAFLLANALAARGHAVSVVFAPDGTARSERELHRLIAEHFGPPGFAVEVSLDLPACDVLVATHYSTASLVAERAHRSVCALYFVQDYEPFFNPMGWEYLRAERSYRLGLRCVALGAWLASALGDHLGIDVPSIPFWIERDIYYPHRVERERRIVFLARPEMPRRCFELGIRALEVFYRSHPDVEIVLFGSAETRTRQIPFPHVDLGVIPRAELGRLYSTATLGLVFSTTNPSFVGYEMMACRCPVLDLVVDGRSDELRYGGRENCLWAEPEVDRVAEAIARAFADPEERLRVAENGYRFARELPDLSGAVRAFEALLRREVAEAGTGDRPRRGRRACPCCGGREARSVRDFEDQGARQVVRCPECGFLSLEPVLSDEEIVVLDDDKVPAWRREAEDRIAQLDGVAAFIGRLKALPGRCLEVGCGPGFLLKAMTRRGWTVQGVELSRAAVQLARELGLPVFQGHVDRAGFEAGTFDVIVNWHILEHVEDPRRLLRAERRLIAPNGLLVVQVPDFDQLPAYEADGRLSDLVNRAHASYFTAPTLTRLLDRSGWMVRSIYFDSRNQFLTAVAEPARK